MRLPGIGALTAVEDYWRLVYDRCGHVQDMGRHGLEDPVRAAAYVRRNYVHCLLCQLDAAGRSGITTRTTTVG